MCKIGIWLLLTVVGGLGGMPALAQTPAPLATAGALVVVPAYGQVTQANDQAHATFMLEEQNRDKAAAASLVNAKMKQGTDLIRQADDGATLQTRGYYTYPVYADEAGRVPGAKARQLIGWRVGQYLEMTTTALGKLAKTVSSAQSVLALNGLQFGLTDATRRRLDQRQIDAAYQNLMQRIAVIAGAMGRNLSDAAIETIDFEGSGADAPAPRMMRAAPAMSAAKVEELSFEPGETTLNMRLVAKIKFK